MVDSQGDSSCLPRKSRPKQTPSKQMNGRLLRSSEEEIPVCAGRRVAVHLKLLKGTTRSCSLKFSFVPSVLLIAAVLIIVT